MGGTRLTAASLAFFFGAILGSPVCAEEAPVVALKQPISVVGYSCKCKSCDAGIPCGGKSKLHPTVVPNCLGETTPSSCDDSCCDAAPSGITPCDAAPCSAGVGTITCDSAPTCGPASSASCNMGINCGCGCDSHSQSWLGSLLSTEHNAGCRQGNRKFGNADCRCSDLCRQQGYWLRAEALMWWTPGDSVPTLATSSPIGTPLADAGVLGRSTTTPLSSDSLFGDMRGGGRVRFGKWANCGLGFDSSGWILGNARDEQSWQSNGNPALAVPFTNVDPLATGPDSQVLGFDGLLEGTLTINSSSEIFGGDAGIRKKLFCCSNPCSGTSYRIDGYAGYRYFRVREGLRITEHLESVALTGPTVFGTTIDLYDDFQTRNEFHGANLGLVAMRQNNCWTTEFVGRVAFGNLDRQVRINGETTVTVPNLPADTRPGGLFAQPTNIGVYEDSDFAVLPEFQVNLGYAINNHTKLTVGYTFMWLGDIVRPGDVIDTAVNGAQLDGSLPPGQPAVPASPRFAWNDSQMWLYGLTLGAEVNF